MSIIRVVDIAFVRFSAPDLAKMREWLEVFGLVHSKSNVDELWMRGYGTAAFVHHTVRGESGFVGIGFRADSLEDLTLLAKAENVEIQADDGPGGGALVRLTDPDGFQVDVVADMQIVSQQTVMADCATNTAQMKHRLGTSNIVPAHSSQVCRLGHCVLNVSDFRASEKWYKDRFGFITSDEIELAPGMAIGAFMRCNRKNEPTDHHTLFLAQVPTGPGLNHAAFEVANLDDLMRGHDHLSSYGATPDWGVGRHVLGSQIFDYWRDPWGHVLEHWTDGDLMTEQDGSRRASVSDALRVQWGMPFPGHAASEVSA
jgi:catechol 2,3-dioxygenase-like lactoylglutathione lyase family enzyme